MNVHDITQEQRLVAEVKREQLVQQITDNPEFKRAFIEYSAELFKNLTSTKYDEADKREEIYRQLKSLNTMESKFLKILKTGSMARMQLTKLQKISKAVKKATGF